MNCVNHPETEAVAFCRTCGKPMCGECRQTAHGTIYCAEHLPAEAQPGFSPGPSPWTAPAGAPSGDVSPGLAFVLGLIPGVGAIYNGQYAKGLIHAVIFGLLVSIPSSDAAPGLEPLFGILIPLWFFYMAFEAYHTARRRQRGEVVDEFSGLLPGAQRGTGSFLAGPVLLIGLGTIFLLHTLHIVPLYQLFRFWPVLLIVAGVFLLVRRGAALRSGSDTAGFPAAQEAPRE